MSLEITNNTQTNDFDVTKITTIAKAKIEGTTTIESRTYIDEREISPQMNISLIKKSGNDYYEFRENEFDADGNATKVWSNCADNLFDFISVYHQKYNKFPLGNVTVSYYDEGAEGTITLVAQSQGSAECTYVPGQGYCINKSTEFMTAYESAPERFTIENLNNAKRQDESKSDMLFKSAGITFNDGTSGYMVFVPWIETPGEDETFNVLEYYPINYSDDYSSAEPTPKQYSWGYITEAEKLAGDPINYKTWRDNGKELGTFELTKTTTKDDAITIQGIRFTNSETKVITTVDAYYVICYCESSTGITEVKAIKIYTKQFGDIQFVTSDDGEFTYQTLELKFEYKKLNDTDTDIFMKFIKYDDKINYTVTTPGSEYHLGKVTLGAHTFEGVDLGSVSDAIPTYMYPDHSLHLPTILI